MDENSRDTGLEARLRETYKRETLTPDQRRQHLNRLAEVRNHRGGSVLRPKRMELVVIASMLVIVLAVVLIVQGLPGSDSGQVATQPTTLPEDAPASAAVSIDMMRTIASKPSPGTGFTYTVVYTSDARLDQGMTTNWEAEVWDRTLEDGTRQQRVVVRSPIDEVIVDYVRNGSRWHWSNRGWVETGDLEMVVVPPAEVTLALEAPWQIVTLLDEGNPPLDPANLPSQIEVEYGEDARAEVAWIATARGLDPFRYVSDLNIRSAAAPGEESYIESMELYLAGEEDQRVLLGKFAYYSEPQLDAASFLDSTFAIPEGAPERFILPADATLPFGLELYDQNMVTPEGGERLLFASETAQVELLVSPSPGGIDASLWQAYTADTYPDTVVESARLSNETAITWRQGTEDGPIVTAVWDDGRYLYRTIAIPLDWTETELIQIAQALSAP